MEMKLKNILLNEFETRSERNTSYSLRAFARDLGIGKSTLHEIVNQDRKPTSRTIVKILKSLGYSDDDIEMILNYSQEPENDDLFDVLSAEQFARIATCEHYAVLSLAKTGKCRGDYGHLSNRLMLPEEKIKIILDDLIDLSLVTIEDGLIVRSKRSLTTSYDVPSSTIKEYHASNLERIKTALYDIQVELRDIASSTFLMSPLQIRELKEDLKNIRRNIVSRYEENDESSEAYLLNFSLIPISQRRGDEM